MTSEKLFESDLQSPAKNSNPADGEAVTTDEISCSIAHAIPGRIRFSIPRLTKDSEYADKLKALIESDSRVTDVRLNQTAASIVVSYKQDALSDDQMRSHLVNLIKNAPNLPQPKQATARSILGAILDALVNLLDSVRNVNQARKGITEGQFEKDFWERLLNSAKGTTKKLKSVIMFVLPKRSRSSDEGSPLVPTNKE